MKRVWLAALVVLAIAVAWKLWPRTDNAPVKATAATKAPGKKLESKRVDPKTKPPATLVGTVTDENKKPLAADVCVVYAEDQRCVKAGADGAFRIAVVVDKLVVTASMPKYRPKTVDTPPLAPSEMRTIEVELETGGVELTGVVEDILGGPIANARVTTDGVRVDTDEHGKFSVWVAPSRELGAWIHAKAAGYGPHNQRYKTPGPVTIALAPESTIVGRVVDANNAPVAGARVISDRMRDDVATTTSADGTFALEQLAAGSYAIEAHTATAYGRFERAVTVGVGERVEDVVVRVAPARTVIATIDVGGVASACTPEPRLNDWSLTLPEPWRDDNGRYHFDGVPPSVYAVDLGCGARVPPIVVGESDVEVTWKLDPGGVVKGRVRFDGKDASERRMLVELSAIGSTLVPTQKTLDVNSTFEFRVPSGRYQLSARGQWPTGGRLVTQTEVVVASGQTVEQDLVIKDPARGKIAGRVYDKDGKGIAKVKVAFDDYAVAAQYTVESRGDGRYEIEIPVGSYRAAAFSSDYFGNTRSTELSVVAENQTTALDIGVMRRPVPDHDEYITPTEPPPNAPKHQLSGRVVDAQDKPVADAIITAEQGYPYDEQALRATTRSDGSFTLVSRSSQLPVAVYRIGGGNANAMLTAAKPTTITLAKKPTIAGLVTRADGSAAEKFQLRIGDNVDAFTMNFDHTGGRFAIEVDALPIMIAPQINGVAGARITIETASTNLALKLPPTATIRGRVVDGGTRKGIAGVRVNGRQSVDGWAPWFIHADQVTDEDGRFTMRDLPPGAMLLELMPATDQWSNQSINVTVPPTSSDLGEFTLSQVRRR